MMDLEGRKVVEYNMMKYVIMESEELSRSPWCGIIFDNDNNQLQKQQ